MFRIAVIAVLFAACGDRESKPIEAKAKVAVPAPTPPPPVLPSVAVPPAQPVAVDGGAVGSPAARKDFIDQSRKRKELPFRASFGRSDTELLVELTDTNDICSTDLLRKFSELLSTQLHADGFTRVACEDQQSSVVLGRVSGTHAARQAFIDEAAKNPDLGFALSYGEVETDLMLELTPPAGSEGSDMPCSKAVLMKLLESFGGPMKAAGYRRFRCKGPWLTIEI